ncbi:MAG: S-layer homology domain-containing protein [Clostridia bacterium]|nr:S-layer homology domain-containing protein [Clostridia bacterium]
MKMKFRLFAGVLAAIMIILAVPTYASAFSDVPDSRWSAEDVAYAVEKGYMNGTGDGKFSPDGTMTRAMVVTVLWRREGSPRVKYSPDFSDVGENEYYSSAVIWAKSNGIVNGTSDKEFSPSANVTREQLAAMLMRYTSFLHYSVTARTDLSVYSDAAKVSPYAADAVAWAVKTGLVTGTTATTLSPGAHASREQFAAILRRYDGVKFEYTNLRGTIDLVYPEEGDEISVLNPLMKTFVRRFYNGDFDNLEVLEDAYNWLPTEDNDYFKSGVHDHTYPVVVNFRWTCDNPIRIMKLQISEREDFAVPASVTIGEVFSVSEGVYSCSATNFKVGTTYYWRVRSDFASRSEVRSFTTAPDRYRPIYLEGGSNVRDLGGWVNAEGKEIRQGAIFRGAEPECYDFEDPHHFLSAEGRRALAKDLGVKTRVDLQEESLEGLHHQGEWYGIEYVLTPSKKWEECFGEDGPEWMRKVFDAVLDTSKYPLYFHCYAGADRTGTVAACLECLLGMDMKDVRFDFDVTTLSICSPRSWPRDRDGSRIQFVDGLAEMYPEKETTQERVEEFLVSIGIAREKIEAFRDYMIID